MIIASACQGCLNNESISHSAGSSMKARVWWRELHQRHGNKGRRWSVTGSRAKAIWRHAPGTLEISLQKSFWKSIETTWSNIWQFSRANHTLLTLHPQKTHKPATIFNNGAACKWLWWFVRLSLATIRPAGLLNIETHVLIQIHAWFA